MGQAQQPWKWCCKERGNSFPWTIRKAGELRTLPELPAESPGPAAGKSRERPWARTGLPQSNEHQRAESPLGAHGQDRRKLQQVCSGKH